MIDIPFCLERGMIGGAHLDGNAYRPSINGSQPSPPSLPKAHRSVEPTKMTSTRTTEPGIHKLDVWQPLTELSEGDL